MKVDFDVVTPVNHNCLLTHSVDPLSNSIQLCEVVYSCLLGWLNVCNDCVQCLSFVDMFHNSTTHERNQIEICVIRLKLGELCNSSCIQNATSAINGCQWHNNIYPHHTEMPYRSIPKTIWGWSKSRDFDATSNGIVQLDRHNVGISSLCDFIRISYQIRGCSTSE